MHFWLCDCGALYARDPVAENSLRNMFGSADFFASGEPGVEHIDYYDFIGGERYLRATAKARIERIRRYRPNGCLLEVASAAGFFLIEAKNAGYDVQGVEISPPMASYASHRWKIPVIAEPIEKVGLPAGNIRCRRILGGHDAAAGPGRRCAPVSSHVEARRGMGIQHLLS